MSLAYENASSGDKAVGEMRKVLMSFGATQFGVMEDSEDQSIVVQFKYNGRPIIVKASIAGYAAAWLREHPYTSRIRVSKQKYEQKAMNQAAISVYSILRDWIKGQITAIHCGVLSFEGAFLGQIMLPTGQTILERIESDNLLPAPKDE